MRINGVWVGWGLGDESSKDLTVKDFRSFARSKFHSYAGHLADNNKFDIELELVVREIQSRYVADGKLGLGTYIPGVLDTATQEVSGFKKRIINRPIAFTVEGHMSNMFVGPTAFVASTLEGQGVCWWQATGYVNTTMPFQTNTGVLELVRFMNLDVLPNGKPFPLGTPFSIQGFSEGAMVVNRFFIKHLRSAPTGSRLWSRLQDLTRVITYGDPYREKNVIAEWVPDPPSMDTQGISDERLTNTPDWWKVHSRHGDMYSENPDDEVGLNRTAVYKIAANNSWSGGPSGLLQRFGDFLRDPMDGTFDIAKAIMGGGLFVFNMGPHGMYDLNPCVEYMRGMGQKRVAS